MEDFAVLLKMCRMKKNVDSSGVKSKFYHILKEKWGEYYLGWGEAVEAAGKWLCNKVYR
jgi:translation initiation factor 2 alpha subunit (eIF-2alpha)